MRYLVISIYVAIYDGPCDIMAVSSDNKVTDQEIRDIYETAPIWTVFEANLMERYGQRYDFISYCDNGDVVILKSPKEQDVGVYEKGAKQ